MGSHGATRHIPVSERQGSVRVLPWTANTRQKLLCRGGRNMILTHSVRSSVRVRCERFEFVQTSTNLRKLHQTMRFKIPCAYN